MKQLILTMMLLAGIVQLSYGQQKYDQIDYPQLETVQEPKVTTFKVDNGIKFYMVEDHELPLIDMQVIIRAGGEMVPDNKTGLASLTGTVMRSGGTKSIPADSLNTLLEDKAAHMETGIGFSSGYANMNVLRENFDHLLPVFVDLLAHPAFPKDKIKLAKKQEKSAISRRNDNIDPIGGRVFDQIIYGKNSKYAQIEEYATINNIDQEDLVNFHSKNFTGKNMMIGIVGDFDTGAMKAKLKRAFGNLPAGQKTTMDFPNVNYNYKNSINFVNKPDVDQSLVLMGHIGGMRDNPDYASVQVMNQVLSGGFSGRLMQQVRTNLGLAYGVGGRYGMNTFYPGQFVIQVKTKSSSTAAAIDAIIKEVKKLQQNEIDKSELQDAQDQILNSSVFHHDSYSKILNERLSDDYRGLPKDAYQQYLNGVKNTNVQDVQRVAQKYLHPDSLQILVVGNKKEIGNQLQKFGNVNTIDVSIPQPGSDNENKIVKGDAQKGKALMQKMAAAVIHSGTEVNMFSFKGKASFANRQIPVSIIIDYPSNVEETIQAGSKIKLMLKDGKATMEMGEKSRALPSGSPQAKNLKATLSRNIVTLAKKTGDLDPQFMGTSKMNGKTYNKVIVQVDDKNITLMLDPKSKLPATMEFQNFSPQKGSQVSVQNKYSKWTTTDGITFAHKTVTMVDGKEVSTANYDSHSVNKP